MKDVGRWNRAIGWCTIAGGTGMGVILGLWSFGGPLDPPLFLAEYDSLPRRLLRLAHIAWIALGVLGIVLARELPFSSLAHRNRLLAARCFGFGNLFLPATLTLAAFAPGTVLLMSLPACAVVFGLSLAAYGAIPSPSTREVPLHTPPANRPPEEARS